MAYEIAPFSLLDAVNECLSAMGEPKVNSLDSVGVDAQMAYEIVLNTSRTFQTKGFHFNHEIHTISPTITGEIVLPANINRVDTIEDSKTVDIVQRGLRLFDRVNNTYVFTKPLKVEMYVILPFEQLPQSAKNYVTIKAARVCQQRLLGSDSLDKFNEDDEKRAWAVFLTNELEVADHNMLTDSYSISSILYRRA